MVVVCAAVGDEDAVEVLVLAFCVSLLELFELLEWELPLLLSELSPLSLES